MCGGASVVLIAAMTDVKDCFHRLRTPRWLQRHFRLAPLRASELGVAGQVVDGSRCTLPRWCILVGPCWLHRPDLREELTAADAAERIRLLRDCAAAWALSKESFAARYVYVDNLGVITSLPGTAEVVQQRWVEAFESRDLDVHKSAVSSTRIARHTTSHSHTAQ